MTQKKMQQTVDVPGMEVTKPARQLSAEADFLVPALQATFSGLFAGTAIGVCAHYATGAPFADAWAVSVAVGVAASWFWRLDVTTRTLYNVERITHIDINRDGVTGDPGHIMALNPYQGQVAQRRDERAGRANVFRWFVTSCAQDTASRNWEPQIGREQYIEWRDLLIASGWAKWRGRTGHGGWDLTADPADIIEALQDADF